MTTTLTAAAAVIAYQSGTPAGPYAIVDSEANVAADLDQLAALAGAHDLSSLTLTDPSDPITITATTWITDRAALTGSGTYSVIVTGATASQGGIFYGGHITSLSIVDSAANVGANLGNIHLNNVNDVPYAITLTDSGTVNFSVSVNDWTYNRSVFAAIQGGNFTVTLAGAVPASSVSDIPNLSYVSSVAVSDTATGIGGGLDALEALIKDGKLTSLTMTGGVTTPIPITVAQITSDADVLALLPSGYKLSIATSAAGAASAAALPHAASVTVTDTAAGISASLDTLETLAKAGMLAGITNSDEMAISITPAQITADADALAALPFYLFDLQSTAAAASTAAYQPHVVGVDIRDTAANISANIDAIQTLQSAFKLHSLTLTDQGTPTLTITDAQYSKDMFALGYLTGTYNIALTGVDSSSAAVRLLYPHVTTVAVVDQATDIPYALDSFQSMLNAGRLTGITLTDSGTPTISISATQLTSDAGALALIGSPYHLAITGATATGATSAAAAADVVSVSVSDGAQAIASNLGALQALAAAGTLGTISISDNNALTLTQAQMASDAQAIADLSGNYWLNLKGVSAASATGTAGTGHVRSVAVTDSAANVAAHLDSLQALAADGELTGITLTDSGTPTLNISQAQFTNHTQALQAISGSYKVATNSVSVSQYLALAAQGQVNAVSISDKAAAVAAALDTLGNAVVGGTVTSIALTDNGTPNLAISYTQLSTDSQALHDIVGSYTLTVSAVAIENLSTTLAASNVVSAGVADSAANISSDLDGLQALVAAGKVTSIALTDANTPTLTVSAAQMVSDAAAINEITGSYDLDITGTSVALLTPTVVAHASAISVSDSGANVAGDLDTLQAYAAAGKLTSVTLTDSGFVTIPVTPAQLTSDSAALSKLAGNFIMKIDASGANLTVSGLTGVANVASFANPASDYAVSAGTGSGTVIVTDIATGRTSTDHLSGLTALQFGSQTDIVAQAPGDSSHVTTGNVTELYGAVFGRLPDVPGLNYYENELKTTANLPLTFFAQQFLSSPEYTNNASHAYAQTAAGDAQFITDSYTNLLGRAPEAGAVSYYQGVIDFFTKGLAPGSAAYTAALATGHAYVLTDFSASSEFLGDVTITAQNPSSAQHWLLLTS